MTTVTKTTFIAAAAIAPILAEVPFGWLLISGVKKSGKTLAGLNSPFQPVHVVDCENSSKSYFQHQKVLIDLGYIRGKFTRTSCLSLAEYIAEATRIVKSPTIYGTLMIDPFGKVTNWIGEEQFVKDAKLVDTQTQLVWGHVRDRINKQVLALGEKCNLLILTAHERSYQRGRNQPTIISPRCNPTVLELADLSIRLVRQPNEKLPTGIVDGARLPFFPPQIPEFTIEKLCSYIQKPADWDKLKDDEKVTETPATALPGFSEARQYEEG